jgi:ABC-type branched-subunit amino acid transport system substrate-binding protein
MKFSSQIKAAAYAAIVGFIATSGAWAQNRYDPGASDTEIKIGNIVPYSGPVSAYGTIGKAAGAVFAKINADGGINGRKINFISVDDAYTPAKTVEQARKLVEQDEVLAIFGALGTTHNMAIQKYMNAKKVPQIFVVSGATRWGEIKDHPWTIGWQPTLQTEGKGFAKHILQTRPNGKVAILVQNDDFGKDLEKGLLDGFGDKAKAMIVGRQTYETTDPTIDSQIVQLKGTGADALILVSTPKFTAMALKKAAEIGWQPARYVSSVSQSVSAVLKPVGFDIAKGVISSSYLREVSDPAVQASKEYQEYAAVLKQFYPGGDPNDVFNLVGYSSAQTMVQVLRQAGDNLTRENLMKQALTLNMTLPMLLPGIKVQTSPNDAYPIQQTQLLQFNGTRYELIGSVIGDR